ncbi:MAG: EI24 domain-containing protein [Planctomycetes bacterium]|nr:EI24 domain-containing protein [Planctomycetota bacterium]
MSITPCKTCGYDSPAEICPHCSERPEGSIIGDPEAGLAQRIGVGFAALPRGMGLLLVTGGVKRFLLPPLFLTSLAFSYLFYHAWVLLEEVLDAANLKDPSALNLEEGWIREAAIWLIETGTLAVAGYTASFLTFLLLFALLSFYTFSVLYEALAGPFLDEIHGRFERRWFGADPRDAIQRPDELSVTRCVVITTSQLLVGALIVLLWDTPSTWLKLLVFPLPLLATALLHRSFGKWLTWVMRTEAGTLWVSVKAALFAGLALVLLSPLHFIPGIGSFLFGFLAGFPTAITLLDIPFSRRQWSTSQRIAFVRKNFLPVTAFGSICGLLFVIPVLGPLVMVPSASVGGLWLICRFDKSALRPAPPVDTAA